MKQRLTIDKMSCQHCVQRITEKLSALPGVESVSVDLEKKQVDTITSQSYTQSEYQAALHNTIYVVTAVE